jgi:outer membrane receptor protein involved in Fe transport
MGVRHLLIASISVSLGVGVETVRAQDASDDVQQLPPVVVSSGDKPGVKRGHSQNAPRRIRPRVVSTTPLAGSGIDADKVPASINSINPIDANLIKQTGSLNIADSLVRYVPGITLNEVNGNPFTPDVQFRGFTASPVAGTPQGLAVYQNGVRINEAFGDNVNWDLIPTAAIKSIDLVTNNPAFGLNALGGAVVVQMKDGFSYHGAEIDTMGGSFGRIQNSLQWGKQIDNFAVYGALEGVHEDGFRNFQTSNVRRFYGDIGTKSDNAEFHVNLGLADNDFGVAATTPNELLQQYWGATYTTPQTTTNKVGYVNFTGKVEVTPTWTIDGVAHARLFNQNTQDGNPTDTQPCTDPTLLCFGDSSTPANGLNGAQLANPFAPDAILGENDRTTTRTTSTGFSLQATNTDQLFGHNNQFVVGTSFDYNVTKFTASAELGTVGTDYVVSGSGIFLGQSGDPVSIGPVDLRAVNQYTGIYALDTFDVTRAFSITAGGRYNIANINLQDQIPGGMLNGNDTYTRFNPIVGGTYKITPGLTAYAGYSEANRAPTPLELGCADPAHPCIIATFLVADPPLKQVVSHTWEAGLRGTQDLSIGSLGWKLGVFRAENSDDILAVPSPQVQGFGFFQNVGSTRRQGIEAEATLKAGRLQVTGSYTYLDARFLDALQLASNSPFADPVTGNIQVVPGDQIPSLPRNTFKARFDYRATDQFTVGADMQFVGSQFFAGDDSNQYAKLPSYTVYNMHASYQVTKNVQIYARADNILDNRYATYGIFFDTTALPNFATGNAFTDPTSLSPARPRAFYTGMKITF